MRLNGGDWRAAAGGENEQQLTAKGMGTVVRRPDGQGRTPRSHHAFRSADPEAWAKRHPKLQIGPLADRADEAHAFERCVHHLHSSTTLCIVGSLRFHELGVGEDDAELIVQLMKQALQIRRVEGFIITLERNLGHAEQCL